MVKLINRGMHLIIAFALAVVFLVTLFNQLRKIAKERDKKEIPIVYINQRG